MQDINECDWAACAEVSGNIIGNPSFIASDDCSHAGGSPCRDAGVDPAAWDTNNFSATDIDGDARPQGGGWDIGTDEYVP